MRSAGVSLKAPRGRSNVAAAASEAAGIAILNGHGFSSASQRDWLAAPLIPCVVFTALCTASTRHRRTSGGNSGEPALPTIRKRGETARIRRGLTPAKLTSLKSCMPQNWRGFPAWRGTVIGARAGDETSGSGMAADSGSHRPIESTATSPITRCSLVRKAPRARVKVKAARLGRTAGQEKDRERNGSGQMTLSIRGAKIPRGSIRIACAAAGLSGSSEGLGSGSIDSTSSPKPSASLGRDTCPAGVSIPREEWSPEGELPP